jgi:hypothetical protein
MSAIWLLLGGLHYAPAMPGESFWLIFAVLYIGDMLDSLRWMLRRHD